MARQRLEGEAEDQFIAAVNRAAIDMSELAQLVQREPDGLEDWMAQYTFITEALNRLRGDLCEMSSIALGIDASPFFGGGESS